ncbi:hypothetical protein B0H16DRAFT_1465509 [Mycena metata]|uniref:Uncharacterized protein n=1 Tax=Mycena metata TaxID=1033252 RepID=A0AAD7ICG7_9AGAR|nr:hypothetical protein B0H16DRAFT_1465509 [Mycena metata]
MLGDVSEFKDIQTSVSGFLECVDIMNASRRVAVSVFREPQFFTAKAKAKLISLPKAMAPKRAKPKPTIWPWPGLRFSEAKGQAKKAKAKARTSLALAVPIIVGMEHIDLGIIPRCSSSYPVMSSVKR